MSRLKFRFCAVSLLGLVCGLSAGLALLSPSLRAQENPPAQSANQDNPARRPDGAVRSDAGRQDQRPAPGERPNADGPQQGGRGGPGGFGRGGPGGFGGGPQETKLVKQFDKDGNNRLNADERKAAREFLQTQRTRGRGPGGPGGRGGGFGPGMMLAPQMVSQADKNGDQKLSQEEFVALADGWFDKLDPEAAGKLSQERFVEKFSELLPAPQGFGGRGRGQPGNAPSPRTGGPGEAPDLRPADAAPPGQARPGGFGRGGGRGFGPAGFIVPGLFTAADTDKDGSLSRLELKSTFEKWFAEWDSDKSGSLNEQRVRDGLNAALPTPNFGGPGGFDARGRGENQQPVRAGPRMFPADVKSFAGAPVYDAETLRTFFIEFENPDWERELADFYHSDVEVPAKLTVDGKTFEEVGVHFRGTSSYMGITDGRKRSLNLSLDFARKNQNLGGYRTFNLLNGHSDPTFLRTVLYNHIARAFIPAPKVNYVRVVINGESWGVYVNAQQFNKDFTKEWFGNTTVARWKMIGNQRGTGRFNYLGEDVAEYKRAYEIKTADDPKAWADLIKLCRTLNQTPSENLEEAVAPLLDIDGILKFLAVDNTLINSDGYWVRTGDYNVCQDAQGRFHIIPHDANETFGPPLGPGMVGGGSGFGGGPRISGVNFDPLAGIEDPDRPLLHKLLAVPSLRTRYLGYVRAIADEWLDWKKLGPLAEQYQTVIAEDVKADGRKLYPTDAFVKGVTEDVQESGFRGPSRTIGLKSFAEQRRAFLLDHPEVKKAGLN